MDVKAHFESLTKELEALRDRVRNFSVDTPNWQTDGEWKESALRSVLRGYLPSHIEPLRGFVVTPDRGSGQIDVILYDNRQPVLFRNGDLVFVTPDAVRGIVEVKSNIHDRNGLRAALDSLSTNAEMIRSARQQQDDLFVGLFSYQTEIDAGHFMEVLVDLREAARTFRSRIINHVSLGCSHFIKFWEYSPSSPTRNDYDEWHSYSLINLSAGYFINNLVRSVAAYSVAINEGIWFPAISNEPYLQGKLAYISAER